MNTKILLLMVLAASLALLAGCAGKMKGQDALQQPNATAPGGSQASGEPAAGQTGDDARDLADLFQIDTDKPISDEGLDVSTPSSGQG